MSDVKRWALNQHGGMSPMPVAENGKYMLITGIEYVLATDYDAQSLELQAVREALREMLEHAPSMDGRVVDQARAALKPSRGA